MVAYSFQPMFVRPIMIGLGLRHLVAKPHPKPKLQTIRANSRKRHARPTEIVQLYCQQRTPKGFKIGDGRCRETLPIILHLGVKPHIELPKRVIEWPKLDQFANDDGFDDWNALVAFWAEHHPRLTIFRGIIVLWEPTE